MKKITSTKILKEGTIIVPPITPKGHCDDHSGKPLSARNVIVGMAWLSL